MTLEGKTVLITGAARRLGRAMAIAVAKEGGNVIIHYRGSEIQAQTTRDEIEKLGVNAHLLQADLSRTDEARNLVPRALEHGPLFGLVNNASVFAPLTLQETDLKAWELHMSLHATAPFLLSQSFAATLAPEAPGRIVNLLDWRAMRPGRDHFPYTVSKATLAALTRAQAVSLAPNISVNGMALGAVLPPSDGGDTTEILRDVPAGRWAEIEDVTSTLIFLLTGPQYITGEIIHVDGGRHLV